MKGKPHLALYELGEILWVLTKKDFKIFNEIKFINRDESLIEAKRIF